MRFRITIELTRTPKPIEEEPDFEHRDTDALVEATDGGDPREHRMGFVPSLPERWEDAVGMQPAKVQYQPGVRPAGSQIEPPREGGAR